MAGRCIDPEVWAAVCIGRRFGYSFKRIAADLCIAYHTVAWIVGNSPPSVTTPYEFQRRPGRRRA
jgi:hypothetical protein